MRSKPNGLQRWWRPQANQSLCVCQSASPEIWMEFCLENVLCVLPARVRVGNPWSDFGNRILLTPLARGCFGSLDRLDRILKPRMKSHLALPYFSFDNLRAYLRATRMKTTGDELALASELIKWRLYFIIVAGFPTVLCLLDSKTDFD